MTFPTFSAGEILRAQDMNAVALWLVKTQTIGTGVSSVTVTGAFSADYDNYRVLISGVDCSVADTALRMTLNNSAGSTYVFSAMWNNYSTLGYGGNNSSGTTSWTFGLTAATDETNYQIEIMNPFLTKRTTFNVNGTSGNNTHWGGGLDTNAVSQTGFTLLPTSGTLTGGTIRVYGYKN